MAESWTPDASEQIQTGEWRSLRPRLDVQGPEIQSDDSIMRQMLADVRNFSNGITEKSARAPRGRISFRVAVRPGGTGLADAEHASL